MKKGATWNDLLDRAIQMALDKFLNSFQSSSKIYSNHKSSFDDFAKTRTKNETKSLFANNLLVLTAAVMNADGKVMKSELEFVRVFFYKQFPKEFADIRIKMLREVLKMNYDHKKAATLILESMPLSQRSYLLTYLFQLAQADGNIVKEEVTVIDQIAKVIGFIGSGYDAIKAKYIKIASENEFSILGIKKDATTSEVKKAYRKLAIKFHPDKLTEASEEEKNLAKKEFQKIQNAYEKIMKARAYE